MTKHYGISGVAEVVQLGKRGGHMEYDKANGVFKLTGADGSTISRVKVADGTAIDDAASFGQLEAINTALGGRIDTVETQIGDFETLTTTDKSSIVAAINEVKSEIGSQIGELGTMSTQNADAVAITGGSIAGVTLAVDTIAEHTADAGVTVDGVLLKDGSATVQDMVVQGDLTVLGNTVSLEVAELKVSDNVIELNKDETGAGVTAGTAGIEINRGTEDNVTMVWDEAQDAFVFKYSTSGTAAKIVADFDLGAQLVGRENGGFGADISGFADDSLVFANGTELAKGVEGQVLTVTATGVEYKYAEALRNATTGKVAVDTSGVTSATGEYLEVRSEADKVFLTAKNEAGTGDVDLYIQGQGNGDVIIAANASNEGLIIGEDGTSLTISGGAGTTTNAGNLVLKGGDGSETFESGDIILQGGTGGAAEGIVMVRDSAGNMVASFTGGTENAVDYVDFVNGVGETVIKGEGASTDVNIVLAPKGNGFVVAPVGYDLTSAPDEAFITKGSVESITDELARNIDPLVRRATVTTDGTNTSFAIGDVLPVVTGKGYFVSRVVVRVGTDLDSDYEMQVVSGAQVIAEAAQLDTIAGVYIVDFAFAAQTASGQGFSLSFGTAPTAGQTVEVVVEYKVDNVA